MRYRFIMVFLLLLLGVPANGLAQAAQNEIIIVCYHDVGKIRDAYSITAAQLDAHLAYLRDRGYSPISLDQYIAYCKGEAAVPPKAVLLSFDDGDRSFYSEVWPLLKKYNYPALLAVVTSWQEEYAAAYGGALLTWDQMREIDKSGLVAFASHSHDSHRFLPMNRDGDRGAATESFQFRNGKYETLEQYKGRLRSDLRAAQTVFAKELGHPVKAVVWPYGAYTQFGVEAGKLEGAEAFFGLGRGINTPGPKALEGAERVIIRDNLPVESFAALLKHDRPKTNAINGAQLDLDLIYDPNDSRQTEYNLDLAIRRLQDSRTNVVFLQAFSDPDGSGNVASVYFKTDKAPVRSELFNHAAAKLRASGFRVYAWMPTLACQWLVQGHSEDAVQAFPAQNSGWYKRATPFSPRVRQELRGLIADLAAYNYIDGILFQDDLYLNDFEDYSAAARQVFEQETGGPLSPATLEDKEVRDRWTQMKTTALTELTLDLAATAKQYRPYLLTARNIYPVVIQKPQSQEWLAQNFRESLQQYDFTVIMAYPYLEQQYDKPLVWLAALADKALADKSVAHKIVFKLQTYDWNKKRWLSAKELRQQHEVLKQRGAVHFSYYPENVFGEAIGSR